MPPVIEGAEAREIDNKVRCSLCLRYNLASYGGKWISVKTFKNAHRSTETHKTALLREKQERSSREELARKSAHEAQMLQTFSTPVLVLPTMQTMHDRAPPNSLLSAAAMEQLWMLDDGDTDSFQMDPGPEELDEQSRSKLSRQIKDYDTWEEGFVEADVYEQEQRWQESEEDEVLTEILENMALGDAEGESLPDHDTAGDANAWFPYPSKVMFLLNTIDNLPRQRISSTIMKVIIWLIGELGVRNVPSFDALRKLQTDIRENNGVPTIQWKSSKGNVFSFNDPQSLVANDWSNPLTCRHIRRYPVIPKNGVVSEIWHAEKWHRHLDWDTRSPMYDAGDNRHYFIGEPASLICGRVVVPVQWLEDEVRKVWVEVWDVELDPVTKKSMICDSKVTLLAAESLRNNMLDLIDEGAIPEWSDLTIEKGHQLRIPNPDRALAKGDPIYSSFIDLFGDDVSGNRSKSWNKHWNVYINHRNLPRKLLFQQYHTHFVSTSTHASVPEQFEGIKSRINETQKIPIETRHAVTGKAIRLKLFCNCGPGDNPSQSETCGHIGGKGNYPCRKCHIGGTQKEKESDQGFHSMFTPGVPRSASNTLRALEEQVSVACNGVAERVKELQTTTGVKDAFTQYWIEDIIERSREMKRISPGRPLEEIRKELLDWVKENYRKVYNPFLLDIKGFDAAIDTPVEILHTILLGVVKYTWHFSHTSWDQKQKQIYSTRLQSTNTVSLSIPPIRSNYIMQYANSLIGRQLKTLAQVNSFHVYDIVDSLQFDLTKAIGELSALLWFPEIRNMDQYLLDVETAAANVLDIAAKIDPTKLISKIKYHLLVHLREDILRFGPLVGVATEIFECFNAIFRFCSILSNHISPSRDIATQLAQQETIKHHLSGGWWYNRLTDLWVKPGPKVQSYITSNTVLQNLCGWVSSEVSVSGTTKLIPKKRSKETNKLIPLQALPWSGTKGSSAINILDGTIRNLLWYQCKSLVSINGDTCILSSWVYAKSPFGTVEMQMPIAGRIVEILQASEGEKALAILDVFEVGSERDDMFGMPILSRRMGEVLTIAIPTSDILFDFNAQHDCCYSKCAATGTRNIVQERQQTQKTEARIEHILIERYLINIHSFHNAHLIRHTLPHSLTAPIPYTRDRQQYHDLLAAELRGSQENKRLAAAQKLAVKKAKELENSTDFQGRNKRKRNNTVVAGSSEVNPDNMVTDI